MKTTLGGPRDVRIALEGALGELKQKETALEADKAKLEGRSVDAEAKSVVAENKFKLKDLLPHRWKRIFVKRETYTNAFTRIQKAHSADLERARAELKTVTSLTAPFQQLCAELRTMAEGSAQKLDEATVRAEQGKRQTALAALSTLEKAVEAAGVCEATSTFPAAQLKAMQAALTGDLDALRSRLDAEAQKRNWAKLEAAVVTAQAAAKATAEAAAKEAAEKAAQEAAEAAAKEAAKLEAAPHEPMSMRDRRLAHAGQVAKDDEGVGAAAAGGVQAAKPKVADKQGPLMHVGAPVEFGAEKETNMKGMSAGDKFAPTEVQNFDRGLIQGKVTPDMLVEGAKAKPFEQLVWKDLNDRGKSTYALAFSEKYTRDPSKPAWPVIKTTPEAMYGDVDFEPNGWIEIISKKFDTIKNASVFLQKFGWGHVHTTWMRGASPDVQKQQTSWLRNANLWMFLDSLEGRGASSGGEGFWRFAIKGLSIPTEDHLKLALEMIGGKNQTATAFSKHLHIGLRASGKYGHPNRIGAEARGGIEDQKKRVIDSLLNGLCQEQWGSAPAKYGEEAFKLVTVNNTGHQVNALPSEFRTLVAKHLQEHPVGNLTAADADRLFQLVAGATFYDGRTPNARLNAFDQRGCTPLLNFEALSWLTDDEKKRAVDARGKFIQGLADLDAKKGGMKPSQIGQAVADLIVDWSRNAKLAGAFGRWLDGPERQHFFAN